MPLDPEQLQGLFLQGATLPISQARGKALRVAERYRQFGGGAELIPGSGLEDRQLIAPLGAPLFGKYGSGAWGADNLHLDALSRPSSDPEEESIPRGTTSGKLRAQPSGTSVTDGPGYEQRAVNALINEHDLLSDTDDMKLGGLLGQAEGDPEEEGRLRRIYNDIAQRVRRNETGAVWDRAGDVAQETTFTAEKASAVRTLLLLGQKQAAVRERVSALIFNDNGEVLVTRKDGKVLFPGGGIDGEETPEQAAVREAMEETATRVERPRLLRAAPLKMDWDDDPDWDGERTQYVSGRYAGRSMDLADRIPEDYRHARFEAIPALIADLEERAWGRNDDRSMYDAAHAAALRELYADIGGDAPPEKTGSASKRVQNAVLGLMTNPSVVDSVEPAARMVSQPNIGSAALLGGAPVVRNLLGRGVASVGDDLASGAREVDTAVWYLKQLFGRK